VAKKLTRANFDAIRDHVFDCIHKNGETLKNNFPNKLRAAIEAEIWTEYTDAEGKPFDNLVEWLQSTFPNGTSMGQGQHAISYEDALKLTEGAQDVHRVLLESAPKGKRGPKRKEELNLSTDLIPKRSGAKKVLLAIRLAQEKPEFMDRLERGEFKTITETARAAGLRPADDNLRRAKSAFRKMRDDERIEFLKWMKSPEGKEAAKKS
jgi:hypothetical protein